MTQETITIRSFIDGAAHTDTIAPSSPFYRTLLEHLPPSRVLALPIRRPGARTLGGWRRKVMLPDVALDVLMGGEQTAEQVKATLTPETVIALGTLVAARLSRPHLPESIREQATFRGFA